MRVSALQLAAWIELLVCWIVWSAAFIRPSRQAKRQEKAVRAPSSRWGIALVTVGFALVWMWVKPPAFEKSVTSLIVSMVLGPPSVLLAWAATRELGKQWRYEAALIEDHELIQTGPYRWIRHPIYTSMFGMLMATGAACTWWPMWIAGAAFFVAGTEIRVRAEDRLLAERFQQRFQTFRKGVPAYIPFLR
ncbi:MAG TPA: isoprenylcysteine carboxylmethyltransferase family protein [Acidobacteriaceae bacterium]|jgi:protein-S-isoprenylcysteine O-methyltransferase Ste14|nr:isoprenylcysteine carboxylmethyltransferase family protein [Acidobacteriaceae bacterium]